MTFVRWRRNLSGQRCCEANRRFSQSSRRMTSFSSRESTTFSLIWALCATFWTIWPLMKSMPSASESFLAIAVPPAPDSRDMVITGHILKSPCSGLARRRFQRSNCSDTNCSILGVLVFINPFSFDDKNQSESFADALRPATRRFTDLPPS